LAALAAVRRSDADLAAIQAALDEMERDIEAGGRGVDADEQFHGAITTAARSELLTQMMAAIHDLIRETRLESLSQPGRPRESLAGHRKVADAIAAGDPEAAAQAMHEHVMLVSDVALLREQS
jgi:GntR family transcriptional repressor for pyruvate dehydrogenase complex